MIGSSQVPSADLRHEPLPDRDAPYDPSRDVLTQPGPARVPGEVDVRRLVQIFLRGKWIILGCGALFFVFELTMMLLAKPVFTANTVVLIPTRNPSAAALKAELASVAPLDLLGGGYEVYSDMIKSRSVRLGVVQTLHLTDVYHLKTPDALIALAGATVISTQPEGLITVSVTDTSPQRAADIANEYIRQLAAVNARMVLSSAGEQRLFLEGELAKEREALSAAEDRLASVQKSTNSLTPQLDNTSGMAAVDSTRALLRSAQVQLAALLTGETEANPDVQRQRSEIARLQGLLAAQLRGQSSDDAGTPVSQLPNQALTFDRAQRDVKFNETLYASLASAYEAAKLEEAKNPSLIEVLDPATPPEHKSGPKRTVNVLVFTIAGFVVGFMLVAVSTFIRRVRDRRLLSGTAA